MELADKVNGFVDENKPWEIAKDPEREADLQRVCSITLEAFRMTEPVSQASYSSGSCWSRGIPLLASSIPGRTLIPPFPARTLSKPTSTS